MPKFTAKSVRRPARKEGKKKPAVKRVVIVTPDFPPDAGGVAVSVRRVAGSLARSGVAVLVVVPKFTGYAGSKPVMEKDEAGGFSVARVSVNSPQAEGGASCTFAGFSGYPQAYFLIKILVQAWAPDVLHSFSLHPFALHCAIIARELHLPLVVGVRGNDVTATMFAPSLIASIQVALANADLVAPVATQLGDYCQVLQPDISDKIQRVANGLELTPVALKRVRDLGPGTVQFGTVCIQRPKKNLDVLVNAFCRLHARHPHAQLVIIGPILSHEKRAIRQLGLGRAITFTGILGRQRALATMGGLDVFVIPSTFEGCANTMLEAMSFGLPIVASKTGGALDFIQQNKNGLLFEPLDEDTLLQRLTQLLSADERRRLGGMAQYRPRSALDEEQDWLQAYRRTAKLFREKMGRLGSKSRSS
jgi:glycosyltransferase involved in cell wall biosynthesis